MVTRTLQYKCLRPRLKRLLGVIFKSLSVSESCCLYPQHKGDVTQDFRGHPWSHNLQSWYPESQATLLPGPALPSSRNPSCPTPSSGNLHCPTPAMKHFALSILSSICRMLATCQPSLVFYMRPLFWSSQPLYEGKDGFPQIPQVCWSPPALPSAEAAVSPLLTSSPSRLQFCSPSSGQTFTNPTNKSKCTPQIAVCISEALYHSRRFLRIILWENNLKLHRSKT